ncbi:MAG: type 4a pilus biogenesis protein PilO [Phycisphaerales bacterium]
MSARLSWTRTYLRLDLAGVVTLLGLSFFMYVFGVRPLYIANRESATKEAELTATTAQADTLRRAAVDLHEKLTRAREIAGENPIQLHGLDRLNLELAQVTELAVDCGLATEMIQSGDPIIADMYAFVPIRLTAKGEYRDAVRFMHRLHRESRDIGLNAFKLSGNLLQPNQASFEFGLLWYTLPNEAASEELAVAGD